MNEAMSLPQLKAAALKAEIKSAGKEIRPVEKVKAKVEEWSAKGKKLLAGLKAKTESKPREALKEIEEFRSQKEIVSDINNDGEEAKLPSDKVAKKDATAEINKAISNEPIKTEPMQNRGRKNRYLADSQFDAPKRYADPRLVRDELAEIKHIVGQEGNRDIFGNRIFTSDDKAYQDREGDNVRAGLLISLEGESFVRTNPGILTNIDNGLIELEYTLEKDTFKRKTQVDFGEGRKMTYLTAHGQSSVYLLEVGKEKYIVKTKNYAAGETFATATQPYINEMLQTQTFARDLKDRLTEINIHLPTYMLASGQISCMKFEEGNKPKMQEYRESFERLYQLSSEYIQRQQNDDVGLWKNVAVDLDLKTDVTRNFIKKSDDSLVWIDPFLYQPAENTQ